MHPPAHGCDLPALSTLDDPVRSRLYQLIAGRAEPIGRDEAAAAVGIGRGLAAYHLDKLVEVGLLTASYRRLPGRGGPGAGRPAKVYDRSRREFAVAVPPREYELAALLLATAIDGDPEGQCREALRDVARRHGAAYGRRHDSLGEALRDHGFQPWRDARGTLRLRNCPFRALAGRYPQVVCAMNLSLIEGMVSELGGGQQPRLEPSPGQCCVAVDAADADKATDHDLLPTPGRPSDGAVDA
ncbi:MAG: helix-turn-helix transcriptional regulator [Frankiaceae bacterium]